MAEVQDQLDEVHQQFVELNDVIEQNVTKAIQYVFVFPVCVPCTCVMLSLTV